MISIFEQLTALEILFILLWLAAVVYGVTTGPIRQLFMIGSTVLGMLIGAAVAGPISVWTGPMSGVGKEGILPFTHAVFVVLIALVVYVIVIRSNPNTKFVSMPKLDKISGGIAGLFSGVLLISQISAITDSLTRSPWAILDGTRSNIQSQLTSGPFLPFIAETFPLLVDAVKMLMPHL